MKLIRIHADPDPQYIGNPLSYSRYYAPYCSVSYLITEDVWMVLEYGDDKLDGLHRHVELLVQGHRHNPVLELGGEQLQLVLKTMNNPRN
jgi:hypothetical protein